jgi:hypothetical protein
MKTPSLLSGAVLCALLVGCQSAPMKAFAKGTKLDCDGTSNCTVAVAAICDSDPQKKCDITADPDLVILRSSKGVDKITWLLAQGSDYFFPPRTDPTPGVEIDNAAFDCKEDGKWKYVCTSTTKDFGVFKYTINLRGPRKVNPLDPWVVNN